jgi:NAD(P)H-dependent FMN reductase
LLISGSLRVGSTNTAALKTAAGVAPAGTTAHLYDGLAALPAFNPDDDHDPLPAAVARLRDEVHRADGLVFSVPEYAGALPGSLKNLLDWTIGDPDPRSVNGKPVAWLNVSARGAADAHDSLRRILRYAGARLIEGACLDVPVTQADVGQDGSIADERIRGAVAAALHRLVEQIGGRPEV